MNEEIEKLQQQVTTLKSEVKELRDFCEEMFKLNIKNQETTRERITLIAERLHHHLTNL